MSNPSIAPDTAGLNDEQPWPGLQSYGEADTRWFRGREYETEELLRLVRRETLTVLFGQSGQGKTSLLQAGLFPRLRDEDLLPVYIRLDLDDGATDLVSQIGAAIARECAIHQIEAPKFASGESLWQYFQHRDCSFWSPRSRLLTPVLVFDQFEEIFTLGRLNPARRAACDALLAELGDLIENRCPATLRERIEASPDLGSQFDDSREAVKIVFSFREDYLADFEILHDYIRARTRNRLRLVAMDGARTCIALLATVESLLDAPMAELVVRKVTGEASAALTVIQVEPALLSLFCRELNEQRLATKQTRFTPGLLQSDSTGQIISKFYERAFVGLDPRVRHFVEDRLLTRDGHRDSCALENALAEPGLDGAAIQTLTDRRLLRREERGQRVRLELVHDVLSRPALNGRDQRKQAEALATAQREAVANRRKVRRMMALGVAMFVMVLVMLGLSWQMREKNHQMAQMARVSLTRQLAAQANEILSDPKQRWPLGVLLALEAQIMSPDLSDIAPIMKARSQVMYFSRRLDAYDVQSIAFSPDNKTFATGCTARLCGISIWDVFTGERLFTLSGDCNRSHSVAFSPDGKTLASADDKTVCLWNIATRELISGPMLGHTAAINSVIFSPDGKTLASASRDHTARLWDVATHKLLGQPLRGHKNSVNSVVFSPNGKILASASADHTIRLWDVATHKPLSEPLRGHTDSIESIGFSPDGQTLSSASWDKTLRLWNIVTRKPIGEPLLGHENEVNSITFSPNGKILASASADHTIRLWDVASRQSIDTLRGHEGSVLTIAFSSDGKMLASGGGLDDHSIRLWDLTGRHPLNKELQGHQAQVLTVALSPDAVAAGGIPPNSLELWKLSDDSPQSKTLKGNVGWVSAIAFSPDGKTLASADDKYVIHLWDVTSRTVIGEPIKGHEEEVSSLTFSPDGKMLASVDSQSITRVWDVATHKPISEPPRGRLTTFSADSKTLTGIEHGKSIVQWSTLTHKSIQVGVLLSTQYLLAFSPDGKTYISRENTESDDLSLWDVASGKRLGNLLHGHTKRAVTAAFSPDGKILASGGEDMTVRLWDLTTYKPIGQPLRSESGVLSIAFSPNGKLLASAGWGKTVHVWNIDFAAWPEHLCKAAGRNLTNQEWGEFIGDSIPYHETCPDLK